jgi:Sec34-like family
LWVAIAERSVQHKLVELTDDIGSYLEYFQQLDMATRMLNHPGEQLIYQTDFLYMVEKVDICIEFLRSRVRDSSPFTSFEADQNPTAPFQRGGGVSPAIPAVHDEGYDLDQDELCRLPQGTIFRYRQTSFRQRRWPKIYRLQPLTRTLGCLTNSARPSLVHALSLSSQKGFSTPGRA